MKPEKVALFPDDLASVIRRYRDGALTRLPYGLDFIDPPERMTASGRAICRLCGERIARGTPELIFAWGMEPFTFIRAHVHAERCPDEPSV